MIEAKFMLVVLRVLWHLSDSLHKELRVDIREDINELCNEIKATSVILEVIDDEPSLTETHTDETTNAHQRHDEGGG